MRPPGIPSNTSVLWRYEPATGYWRYVRRVTKETAKVWLGIFSDDEPGSHFKVSHRRPRKAP